MNQTQFNDLVVKIKGKRPDHLRYGQWAYNCLATQYPTIASKITATEHDPFHRCTKVNSFLYFVSKNFVQD